MPSTTAGEDSMRALVSRLQSTRPLARSSTTTRPLAIAWTTSRLPTTAGDDACGFAFRSRSHSVRPSVIDSAKSLPLKLVR